MYQLIFPIFGLCLAIASSGIQTAISRFVASEKTSTLYLYVGLLLSVALSIFLCFLVYALAPWISNELLKEPRTESLLRVMVYAIIPACIHSCFNGFYYGKKNSTIPSICQILEQISRVAGTYIIFQVLVSQGKSLEPIHAVWGIVISEFTGMLFNLTAYLSKRSWSIPSASGLPEVQSAVKALGLMAIPLSLNHLLMTLSHGLENLLLPGQLASFGYTPDEALSHFGVLTGMALSVIFFPSAITNSLSVLLLPRVSEKKCQGDMCGILDTIKGALCCGVTLGSLCTFVFLLTGDWFGAFVFDNALAGFYIKVLSILCPFMYTASLLSSIVNGLGHASATLICNLSGCAVRILAVLFFVPEYGMFAYIISMIVAAVLTTLLLLFVVKRTCRA